MRSPLRSLLLLVLALVVAACGDDRPMPTQAPRVELTATTVTAEDIEKRIDALFPTGLRNAARAQFSNIKRKKDGGDIEKARQMTFTLIDYTSKKFEDGRLRDPDGTGPVTTASASAELMTLLLRFVGFDIPDVPAGALEETGGIGVVGPDGGLVTTRNQQAGVDFPRGAVDHYVLVTLDRLPETTPRAGPLPTSFDQYPLFYDLATHPKVPRFNVPVRVGICTVESGEFAPPEAIHDRLRLAHPHPDNPSTIEVFERADAFFLECAGTTASPSSDLSMNGFSLPALASDAARLFRSAGYAALEAIQPRRLYAAHGGCGADVDSFSPFAAVDPESGGESPPAEDGVLFKSTFENDGVDQQPGSPTIGSWVVEPGMGSILVRDGVGSLTTKPVEVAIGTVEAEVVRGPILTGRLAGAAPTSGLYAVRWRSTTTSGTSLFGIRDPNGRWIATLQYYPDGFLRYNNTTTTIPWNSTTVHSVAITIDLRARRTSLVVDGKPVAQNFDFFDPNAVSSLSDVFLTTRGRNVRAGWDEISVVDAEVAEVVVSPASSLIPVGGSVQLSAKVLDRRGAELVGYPVTWATSDQLVATVDGNGLTKGQSAGTAMITAISRGVSGSANVGVFNTDNNDVATGFGSATMDGIIGTDWSNAAKIPVTVNLPGGSSTQGTLYLMNDATNFYAALQFPFSAEGAFGSSLAIEFDEDADGAISAGDDAIVLNPGTSQMFFDDYRTPCTVDGRTLLCGPQDIDDAEFKGTTDGSGTFSSAGGKFTYEIAHPLNSGDARHDIALAAGDRIGANFQFHLSDSRGSAFSPFFPGYLGIRTVGSNPEPTNPNPTNPNP